MCQVLYKAQEPLHILEVPRHMPFMDACHLICVCMQTFVVYYVAKAVHPTGIQIAFCCLHKETGLTELLEHISQVAFVVFKGKTEYE